MGEGMKRAFAAARATQFDWAAFDAKIDKSGECWIWLGSRDNRGYGRVHKDGKRQKAYRVSYERATGDILGERVAMHRCDNPPCVRPDHITPGTLSENFRDMWAKGRGSIQRGERSGSAILSEAAAREIVADPRPAQIVAKERGVSASTIKAIRRGQNWRHLGIGAPRFKFRPTQEEIAEIQAAPRTDVAALMAKFGVNRQAIADIRRKRRRQ